MRDDEQRAKYREAQGKENPTQAGHAHRNPPVGTTMIAQYVRREKSLRLDDEWTVTALWEVL
jgi:hypothetical protein